MKKILLIGFVFFTIQSNAQETYFNMLGPNVIWNQDDIEMEPENPTITTHYEYRTVGDTIIEGKAYYKIIKDDYEEPFLVGYIRQNVSGQVYFRIAEEDLFNNICNGFALGNPPLNEDLLLMDFGVNIGDTIQFPFELEYPADSIVFVNYVDSIDIGGESHRIIHYSGNFIIYGSWIEGVGSALGLFTFFCSEGLGVYTTLECYSNEEPIYGSCVTGIQEINNANLELSIYPNPASESVNLSVAESVKVAKVRVYEVSGRVVLEKRMLENRMALDIGDLSPGMYLIEVETKDGLREVKRMVIK